jgi:hypothetical protein
MSSERGKAIMPNALREHLDPFPSSNKKSKGDTSINNLAIRSASKSVIASYIQFQRPGFDEKSNAIAY